MGMLFQWNYSSSKFTFWCSLTQHGHWSYCLHITAFRKSLNSGFIFLSQSGERREVYHYLYLSWPDFGVPKSATAMLDFREHVLQRREAAVHSLGASWTGPPGGPPVVVHCSAGIGRTGKHINGIPLSYKNSWLSCLTDCYMTSV